MRLEDFNFNDIDFSADNYDLELEEINNLYNNIYDINNHTDVNKELINNKDIESITKFSYNTNTNINVSEIEDEDEDEDDIIIKIPEMYKINLDRRIVKYGEFIPNYMINIYLFCVDFIRWNFI